MATTKSTERYIEAVGRRKTSTARVRITPGSKTTFKVNDRDLATYFPTAELQRIAHEAIEKSKAAHAGGFAVSAIVKGGGIHSQAEALRHGIARALIKHDLALKSTLKPLGMLKRDPRMKERRKFGLKKARKAPQWSKR
jgi:small subunit ribosomal protein S9